jgi:hypothetical protein
MLCPNLVRHKANRSPSAQDDEIVHSGSMLNPCNPISAPTVDDDNVLPPPPTRQQRRPTPRTTADANALEANFAPKELQIKHIAILPFADTVEGITGSLYDECLEPYMLYACSKCQAFRHGDTFAARSGMQRVEFKVIWVDPPEGGILARNTCI